jgi:uncharacterized protein (UPF0333 family)
MAVLNRTGRRSRHRNSRGQALVEFSLVILPFMTLIVAIIEFSFLLTVHVGIATTTQDAVQLAAELGNGASTDFQVLSLIERDVSAPMNKAKIVSVVFFSTDAYGKVNNGQDKYTRGGVYQNPSDITQTVPYKQDPTLGYPPVNRCNVVALVICGGVDYIGVTITYQYNWITPLPGLVGLGSAPLLVQTSVSRLEPVQ